MRWPTVRDAAPPAAAVAAPRAQEPRALDRPIARPRRVERDTSMAAAAQQAGVLSQASREVSDTSQQAAESLTELRAAIGEISTSVTRASAVAEERSGTRRRSMRASPPCRRPARRSPTSSS